MVNRLLKNLNQRYLKILVILILYLKNIPVDIGII
nr:MAG TPA: hypothetical protein [Bacteriophage sp.]